MSEKMDKLKADLEEYGLIFSEAMNFIDLPNSETWDLLCIFMIKYNEGDLIRHTVVVEVDEEGNEVRRDVFEPAYDDKTLEGTRYLFSPEIEQIFIDNEAVYNLSQINTENKELRLKVFV